MLLTLERKKKQGKFLYLMDMLIKNNADSKYMSGYGDIWVLGVSAKKKIRIQTKINFLYKNSNFNLTKRFNKYSKRK